MIHGIDHISHPVKNLEKAVEFYRDILQLDLDFVSREMGWAEFDVGGFTLVLKEIKTGFVPSHSSICFFITGIEEQVKHLRKRGVRIQGEIMEIPGEQGKMASFIDPDGNLLEFYEPPQ
jgi:predicted enzyme related to lactoylglutathione lyase